MQTGGTMKSIAVYDTKEYDEKWLSFAGKDHYNFKFFEHRLDPDTAKLAEGCEGAIAFVNDDIGKQTIDQLYNAGVRVLAMRCAGYNNIDFKEAYGKINVVRVPAYSPHAVAEHAMALILTLNRKIHKAYIRTRDFNFSLKNLEGFDLYGKTIGIIGTGKIGRTFIDVCKGFGLNILCYDLYPAKGTDYQYVSLDELFAQSDIISLHCPLTKETNHIIDAQAISKMKQGVYIINTSRGALIDSEALLSALIEKKVGAAGLDVYEEESEVFFEDFSNSIIKDDVLARLMSLPNVIVTSHQAFLTVEALKNIAETTVSNLDEFFDGKALTNEVCYQCLQNPTDCIKNAKGRCF